MIKEYNDPGEANPFLIANEVRDLGELIQNLSEEISEDIIPIEDAVEFMNTIKSAVMKLSQELNRDLI